MSASPQAIYHIENPVRQPWPAMISLLAEVLDIPTANVIPFDKWLKRVRDFPPSMAASENPAAMLADFLEAHFVRMSCGGLVLDTARAVEDSETMKGLGPVSEELVRGYVKRWKDMGFLRK